ncbi:TonB-dependent receptor plug domain-containing protein [Desulfocicer niacini]
MMKQNFQNRLLMLSLLWLFLSMAQPANAAKENTETCTDLGETVVTATRSARAADELYADVEVVTRQDLEKTTATTLENALRGLPGLDNRGSSSQSWWFTTNIRGIGGGKRSLLMMDGVPLNSALTGFAYPLRTDLFSVEQVEVVKGSFSSLYGSNAMGGVINIISRQRKKDGIETNVRGYGGQYGFAEGGTSVLGKKGKLSFNLDAAWQYFDNQYRRDDNLSYSYRSGKFTKKYEKITDGEFDTKKLFGRFDYKMNDVSSLCFSGNFARNESANGMSDYQPVTRDLGDSRHDFYFLNLSGTTRILNDLNLEMRIYSNHDETDSLREHIVNNPDYVSSGSTGMGGMGGMGSSMGMGGSSDVSPYLYLVGDIEHWGRDTGIQLKGTKALGQRHIFTTGVDYSFMQGFWENTEEDGTIIDRTMDENMSNVAGYLQDEINVTDNFIATLGCRYDINSESENAFSPKLGLFYRLNNTISFRGSVGKAFRAPNLNELYTPTWMMIPGIPFESNPDLEPEEIWSYDLGTTISLPCNLEFSFTAFYSKAENLISNPISMGVMRYENLDEVETDGFEAGISGHITDWLGLHLNTTYTHSVEKGYGRLDNVPLYQANAGITTHHALNDLFSLCTSLDLRYSDETLYTDNMSGNSIVVDDYTVLDVAASLRYKEGINLKLAIHNLTDEEYAIHGSKLGPSRYVWAGLELTL